ncbi:hypothetical protein [Salininema proteolyticum]|uniref:Methyl-accepting chemotaxis protein n=1 Tax=Salininema proteolyticum TaxID=1607685 RepID=A0ABV8TXE7_9ACTN
MSLDDAQGQIQANMQAIDELSAGCDGSKNTVGEVANILEGIGAGNAGVVREAERTLEEMVGLTASLKEMAERASQLVSQAQGG